MKKTFLALLLCAMLAFGAACEGVPAQSEPPAPAESAAPVETTAPTAPPVEQDEGHMLYDEAPSKYFYGVYVNMNTATGDSITDYSVAFNNFADRDAYVFYSARGLTHVEQELAQADAAYLDTLVSEGRAYSIKSNSGFSDMPEGLLSLEGAAFDPADKESFYYVYAAFVGTEGVQLEKSGRFITPKEGPAPFEGYGANTGAIVPAGGATSVFTQSSSYSEGYISAIMQGALDAGVTTPRIAVIETTVGTERELYDDMYLPDEDYPCFADALRALGLEPVYIPLGIDNYEQVNNTPYFADLIRSCHIVFFTGGDQAYYALALSNADGTPSLVANAITDVIANGGTLCGSSAGAAAMSKIVLTNGASGSYQPLYWNGAERVDIHRYTAETVAGNATELDGNNMLFESIGFVEPVLGRDIMFDTHVDARGRIGRLIAGLRDADPTGIAIGLDETSVMRIDGATKLGTVFGTSGVYVINAANAVWQSAGEAGGFGVSGLTVSYLTAGDTYDFNTNKVIPAADKQLISAPTGEGYITQNVFGQDELGSAVLSFASCADASVALEVENSSVMPFLSGSLYTLTLEKTADTACYTNGLPFPDEDYFGSFMQTAVCSMTVSITASPSKFDPNAGGAFEALSATLEDNLYASGILFTGMLSVGYEGNNKYFLDCEQPENVPDDYVEVRGANGELKSQDRVYTFRIDDGKTLRIVLEDGVFFEDGDTMLVKTTVYSIYGVEAAGEVTFTLNGGVWTVAQ